MPFTDRPTADIVLILMAVVVALSVVLTGVGLFVIAVLRPDADLSQAFTALGSALALLIGTVIGYLAGKGRSAGSREP